MKNERIMKILAAASVVIVIIYLASAIYSSTGRGYKTTTAYVQTVSETVDANMFIIRDEEVLTSGKDGEVVVSLVNNGAKVSKGSDIAAIFTSEKSAENYSKGLALQKKLDMFKKIDSQAKLANLDMDKLNSDINLNFYSMLDAIYYDSFGTLSEDQLNFIENYSRKAISLGYDVDCTEQIETLQTQIEKLTSAKPKSIISAPLAGYYVSMADGYENLITTDDVDSLDAEALQKALDADKSDKAKKSVGKIINGFDWYAACIVPNDKISGAEVNRKTDLILGNSDNETISARIYKKTPADENNTLVIFRCSDMNGSLASLRKVTGKIVISSYTGIKVPKSAVRFNSDNEEGVYIREGNLIKFNKIEEIFSNDNFVVASDKSGSSGWLAQYDEIVVSGKELSHGKVIE